MRGRIAFFWRYAAIVVVALALAVVSPSGAESRSVVQVVEGHLEATARARHLMVARGGRFIGSAEVDTAEIHGHFEGNLTVAKRLYIPATGSVAGTTCYQEIVIDAGGQIMGNAQRLSEPAEPGDNAA